MPDYYIHVSISLVGVVHFQLHVRINLAFLGLPSLLLIPISKPKLLVLKKIENKSCQETRSLRTIGGVDWCLFLTSQTWAIMFKAFGPKGVLMEQQGYCDPPMHHPSIHPSIGKNPNEL